MMPRKTTRRPAPLATVVSAGISLGSTTSVSSPATRTPRIAPTAMNAAYLGLRRTETSIWSFMISLRGGWRRPGRRSRTQSSPAALPRFPGNPID
ncbi:Uncharacterised protein [Mycobacteroides abscessus subsp. abscessus]|nr:Uncharacterised protein [Mycobacteroides abscessus subsp. abscessus]